MQAVENVRLGQVIELVLRPDGNGCGKLSIPEAVEEQVRRNVAADGLCPKRGQDTSADSWFQPAHVEACGARCTGERRARAGGDLRVFSASPEDLEALHGTHELVIVATGKGDLGRIFPRDAQKSPYDQPRRVLALTYVTGMDARGDHDLLRGELLPVVQADPEVVTVPDHRGHVVLLEIRHVALGEVQAVLHERLERDRFAQALQVHVRFDAAIDPGDEAASYSSR